MPWPAECRAELAWIVFWLLCLVTIVMYARWEPVSFYLIWISLALLHGVSSWALRDTLWLLAAVTASTAAVIGMNVARGLEPAGSLAPVPPIAVLFLALVWHADRRLAAQARRAASSEENAALLAAQRKFLQDASHQLRTPIAIALGHAELVAGELGGEAGRDFRVVVSELNRLRILSERLLLIAAAEENPDFLRPEPLHLDEFAIEVMRRWRPAAQRSWQLGPVGPATVSADPERLRLAVDVLLENAVQHTVAGQAIRLSVSWDGHSRLTALTVEDAGAGIPAGELAHIFDRFATSSGADRHRGTGLGLSLAAAIIRGHGGEIRVRSAPGQGSRFELMLPVLAGAPGTAQPPGGRTAELLPAAMAAAQALARPPAQALARARSRSASPRPLTGRYR